MDVDVIRCGRGSPVKQDTPKTLRQAISKSVRSSLVLRAVVLLICGGHVWQHHAATSILSRKSRSRTVGGTNLEVPRLQLHRPGIEWTWTIQSSPTHVTLEIHWSWIVQASVQHSPASTASKK